MVNDSLDRPRMKSSGFTLIEGLLITLVVVVAALSGIYVWHKQHKPQATTTSNTVSSQKSSSTPSTATIDIPSFGSQMTVPYSLRDLTFYESQNNPGVLDVSTKTLASLDASCRADSSGDAADGSALGKLTSPGTRDANTVAQLPRYGEGPEPYAYIDYIKPDKVCTKNSQTLVVLNQERAEFANALKTIKPN
jgi:hypothetical protein